MRTLGPAGPEGANVLALGDAIRALKRIGLEADARRLALEALLRGLAAHAPATDGAGAMRSAAGQHQHLEAFLEMLAAERGAAQNTLQAYRRDLEDFLAFLEHRPKSLAAVAPADIGAYLRVLSETGLAPASRARRLSAIRQLFKFLVSEGVIAEDPVHGSCRTQAGPSAAQDALGRGGRSPDRDGAPAHASAPGAATACARCACMR